jgi:tyrosinase
MVYEKALQDCGYKGTDMYWDWVADSGNPSQAAVWDPITGFGGNGQGTGNHGNHAPPVKGSPFKDYRPLYAGTNVDQHSLCRAWSRGNPNNDDRDLFSHRYKPEIVADVLANSKYDDFRSALESGPYAAVHFGVAIGSGVGKIGDLVQSSSLNGKLNPGYSESVTNSETRPHLFPPSYPAGQTVVDLAASG